MTEKRFTLGDRALQEVYAGCIPAILDGKVPCTQSQVLKLLNELYDENEQLKQELKELEAFRYQVFKSMHKITEKENKQ